jgi:hypothetical protein
MGPQEAALLTNVLQHKAIAASSAHRGRTTRWAFFIARHDRTNDGFTAITNNKRVPTLRDQTSKAYIHYEDLLAERPCRCKPYQPDCGLWRNRDATECEFELSELARRFDYPPASTARESVTKGWLT